MENRQHSQDRPTEETPTLYNIFLSTFSFLTTLFVSRFDNFTTELDHDLVDAPLLWKETHEKNVKETTQMLILSRNYQYQ